MTMYNQNTWSILLDVKLRRTTHWVIQVIGSIFCITGIAVEIYYRENKNKRHFSSPHSIVGLTSVVLLGISLCNGITSLFSTELRKYIKPVYSKCSHYFLGASCFILGMTAIILGYEKRIYHQNSTPEILTMLTCFTSLVIILSMIGTIRKVYGVVRSMM